VFAKRRQALLSNCPESSIIVVPAATLCTRSNDTEYPFRQDSNFWYLTGFNEPDAWLVLSNQTNQPAKTKSTQSILFVLPKDAQAEVWHGRRLGAEAAPSVLGFDHAYSVNTIEELLPELLNGHKHLYYALGSKPTADATVQHALAECAAAPKQSMVAPANIVNINTILHAMRRIKSDEELSIMRRAADISVDAHIRAMRFAKPGVFEYQLAAEIHHEFAMQGAVHPAYGTIVGSGENACILHYTENTEQISDGDLVLIDAGCELLGYASDITRTFPVNGRFNTAQKALYQLVLDAQLAALEELKPGSTIGKGMSVCVRVITEGLVKLGILHGEPDGLIKSEAWREYFMHGLGHYLGLDVHDVGDYKYRGEDIPLEPGVVITVEPGLYISSASNVPEQFKGIGIRIEDDIVITQDGHEILTDGAPKSIDEIEALMGAKC